MNALSFPVMFGNTTTNVVSERDAVLQNLKLLLFSERNKFFGDPYYGLILKKLMFDQNDIILRDVVIDAIYTAIQQFLPQIKVQRKDIKLIQDGSTVYATIRVKYMIDYTTDMYTINLINYEVR